MPLEENLLYKDGLAGIEVRRAERFFRIRRQVYLGLLIFVVVLGLPIVAVPSLRHRLQSRVQTFRDAVTGGVHNVVTLKVGENREPFPSEYEHPFVPPRPPNIPPAAVYSPQRTLTIEPPASVPASPRRKLNIPVPRGEEASGPLTAAPGATTVNRGGESDAGGAEGLPKYLMGAPEKEAYDLVLKSNQTLAGMVNGGDPTQRFKSWGAARREDGSFWVRVVFTKSPALGEVEYIWQVKPESKEVIPLSFNARSLPKS